MAKRSGSTSVTYWKIVGMLLRGVARPDSKVNGITSTKESAALCCIVATTDDSNKPTPTAAE